MKFLFWSLIETPALWLENLLKEKLLTANLEDSEDVFLAYTTHGLSLLKSLKSCMESNHEETLLSVNQQQNISLLTQLVIAFGALPFLLPGVGLPLEKRSKFYTMVCPPKDLSIEEVKRILRCISILVLFLNFTFPET